MFGDTELAAELQTKMQWCDAEQKKHTLNEFNCTEFATEQKLKAGYALLACQQEDG